MALSNTVRHLVMNRTNQVIAPKDEKLPGFMPADLKAAGILRKKFSPSFVGPQGEATARKFAEALALKYGDSAFYVATVKAGVAASTVRWVETGAIADEHMADDDESGLDDGTDNE